MKDPKLEALARVPLFEGCPHKELEFLASRADEVDVPAGKTLIRQGVASGTFFVLLEGGARVRIDGEDRTNLGPGDFFGEISMLDGGPSTATVETTTPARLLVMSDTQFRDAVKANDALLLHVMSVMAARLREDELSHSLPA